MPSTSTTQIRQAPLGIRSDMWQRVGMRIPALVRAERMVSPGLASITLLLAVISNIVCGSDQFLTMTASNLQVLLQDPQPMHLSGMM